MLENAVEALRKEHSQVQHDIDAEKRRLISQYVETQQFKPDFLKELQPEIQKGLSFVHDYKQINAQIRQNINVIIESRYNGDDFEDKLHKATREEKAIYEAAKFLEEKLSVARFLMHPEWLERSNECVKFRFHGLVLKYRQIYASRFESKLVMVAMLGESRAEMIANPQAVAVIPHTLIDNSAKYSPKKGKVEIYTQDCEGGIEFAVSSFGPRILPDEEKAIFQPFYRGKLASSMEEEGAGYGLYVSQLVAIGHLGTEIEVQQESRQVSKMGHWTTFSVRLPLRAVIT